jgi:hypothetical protein
VTVNSATRFYKSGTLFATEPGFNLVPAGSVSISVADDNPGVYGTATINSAVKLYNAGTLFATEPGLNFRAGTNVTLNTADDNPGTYGSVTITVADPAPGNNTDVMYNGNGSETASDRFQWFDSTSLLVLQSLNADGATQHGTLELAHGDSTLSNGDLIGEVQFVGWFPLLSNYGQYANIQTKWQSGPNGDVLIRAYDSGAGALVTVIEVKGNKLGFFAASAVAQQGGTGEAAGFTTGVGTAVHDDSTFTGNVGATAYRISDIVKALKNYGLLVS